MHRRALLRAFLIPVFAAVATSAGAAQAVKLARSPKKGETVRYQYEVKGEVATAPFTVSGRTKHEVTEVKDSGEYTAAETNEDTKLVVMGMEQPAPPSVTTVITRTAGNRLREFKSEEQGGIVAPEVQRLLTTLSQPLLPEKAVSSAESWEAEIDNPTPAGKTFKVKTTYAGTEKLGEADAWKITQNAAIEIAGAPFSHEATYWLDPANGQIVKQESAVKNVPSQFGPMSWTETQQRIKP
ncbi:MAG: hypothetical protein ACO1SX_08645 [Actinomycetota bacterium]